MKRTSLDADDRSNDGGLKSVRDGGLQFLESFEYGFFRLRGIAFHNCSLRLFLGKCNDF
jgi:hypothetical protein